MRASAAISLPANRCVHLRAHSGRCGRRIPQPQCGAALCTTVVWSTTTSATVYDTYPSQTSAPITLTAGRYYYVELLHKEGAGNKPLCAPVANPFEPHKYD